MSIFRIKRLYKEFVRSVRVRKWKKLTYKTFPWWDESYFYEMNSYWLLHSSKQFKEKSNCTKKDKVAKEMLIAGEVCKRFADGFIDDNVHTEVNNLLKEAERKRGKSDYDWLSDGKDIPKFLFNKSNRDFKRDYKYHQELLFRMLRKSQSWWD